MRPKLITITFRLSREQAETLHAMMWMDSSESENAKVRRYAKVVTKAVSKALSAPAVKKR